MSPNRKLIAVAGPTASGKTEYSVKLAQAVCGEIVSCDSMQLYKFMDIGSAKPSPEEMSLVKHWMVGEIDPRSEFSVKLYRDMAKACIDDIFSRSHTPVIVGGTGLYLNSLIYDMDFSNVSKDTELRNRLSKEAELNGAEYLHKKLEKADPEKAKKIHPNNVKKIIRALEGATVGSGIGELSSLNQRTEDYGVLLIGITRDREELYERINRRVDIMVGDGLFEEVDRLLNMGLDENDIAMNGIGYKEIIGFRKGLYTKDEAIERIKINTRHLSKRQMTWFRRYSDMHWFNITELGEEKALEDILCLIKRSGFTISPTSRTM